MLKAAIGLSLLLSTLLLFFVPKKGDSEPSTEEDVSFSGDIASLITSKQSIDISDIDSPFAQSIRGVLNELQQRTLSISLNSAHLKKITENAQSHSVVQEELGKQIVTSSQQTDYSLEDVSRRTHTIASRNSDNLELAQNSSSKMETMSAMMENVVEKMDGFSQLVQELISNSEHIGSILEMVQSFSGQTSMLALNASIEAARAGESGRGFAVVADEVRGLATKVKQAADDIDNVLQKMKHSINNTVSETELISKGVSEASHFIIDFSRENKNILQRSEETQGELLSISS